MSAGLAGSTERWSGDIEAVFIDLAAAADLLEATERNVPRLSAGDCARVQGLAHDPERQRMWRARRIATRIVLERFAGSAFRKCDFDIEENGRPVLGVDAPYFNASQSRSAALVAISKGTAVGIDIEQLRPLSMTDDRRRRIISAAARLNTGLPPSQTLDDTRVLEAWVCLEAVAKVRGTGIGRLLTEEGVVGGARNGDGETGCQFEIRRLHMPRGYVAAVAARSLPSELPVLSFPEDAEALARFLAPVAG